MITLLKRAGMTGAVLALAAAGIACSSSDNGGAVNTPAASQPSSGSPSACSTPSAEPQVTIDATDNLTFTPSSMTVKPCQLVVWKVTGSAPHTVTADAGTFDSGTLNKDQTFPHAFPTAGTIQYHCKIHSGMKGTIIVAP